MHLITPTCTPYLTVLPDATLTRHNHAQAYSGTSGVYASSLLKPKFAATWSENVLRWETDLLDTSDKPVETTENSANTASSTQTEAGASASTPSVKQTKAEASTTTSPPKQTETEASADLDAEKPDNDTNVETSEWTHSTFLADKTMEVWALNHLESLHKGSRGEEALDQIMLMSVPHADYHMHVNHMVDGHATRAAWRTLAGMLNELLPSTLCEYPPGTPSLPEGEHTQKHLEDHLGHYDGGTCTHSLESTEAAKEVLGVSEGDSEGDGGDAGGE